MGEGRFGGLKDVPDWNNFDKEIAKVKSETVLPARRSFRVFELIPAIAWVGLLVIGLVFFAVSPASRLASAFSWVVAWLASGTLVYFWLTLRREAHRADATVDYASLVFSIQRHVQLPGSPAPTLEIQCKHIRDTLDEIELAVADIPDVLPIVIGSPTEVIVPLAPIERLLRLRSRQPHRQVIEAAKIARGRV